MKNYLDIQVPKGNAFTIKTKDDFIQLNAVILAISKRGTGKTVALSNILRMMKENQALDRLILVSGTYHNNKHYFENLPLDEEDILEPMKETPLVLIEMLDQMGQEYDEYFEKLKRWKELQKQIKSERKLEDIDDDLLLQFADDFDKPTYKYMRDGQPYKPVVAVFFDDCQGSKLFSPSSNLANLVIKHRHLGKTKDGALGTTLMFACQSYLSNSNGLSPVIRNNATHILFFKSKNLKEQYAVAFEVGGEVSEEDFFDVYDQAIQSPHDFLFIDLHRKKNHPSMFRRNMKEFLIPKIISNE